MTPQEFAKIVQAWADGKQIERKYPIDNKWTVWLGCPTWYDNCQYREKDPYAELKAAAADQNKEIRYKPHGDDWFGAGECEWNWNYPVDSFEIRDKPKPAKKVKLLAWFGGTSLYWRTEEITCSNSKRVPSEDKEIEVEE